MQDDQRNQVLAGIQISSPEVLKEISVNSSIMAVFVLSEKLAALTGGNAIEIARQAMKEGMFAYIHIEPEEFQFFVSTLSDKFVIPED